MERLTKPGPEGIKEFCYGCVDGPHHICADKDACDIPKIYAALQAYENTGLTPEEIKSLYHDAGLSLAIRNNELSSQLADTQAALVEAVGALGEIISYPRETSAPGPAEHYCYGYNNALKEIMEKVVMPALQNPAGQGILKRLEAAEKVVEAAKIISAGCLNGGVNANDAVSKEALFKLHAALQALEGVKGK